MMEKKRSVGVFAVFILSFYLLQFNLLLAQDTPEEKNGNAFKVCQVIEGKAFQSIEEWNCGLAFDGVAACHWRISFNKGIFHWYRSDVVVKDYYKCSEWEIRSLDGEYVGYFNKETNVLVWEGKEYKLVDEPSRIIIEDSS
jgi:hypothetical protein